MEWAGRKEAFVGYEQHHRHRERQSTATSKQSEARQQDRLHELSFDCVHMHSSKSPPLAHL